MGNSCCCLSSSSSSSSSSMGKRKEFSGKSSAPFENAKRAMGSDGTPQQIDSVQRPSPNPPLEEAPPIAATAVDEEGHHDTERAEASEIPAASKETSSRGGDPMPGSSAKDYSRQKGKRNLTTVGTPILSDIKAQGKLGLGISHGDEQLKSKAVNTMTTTTTTGAQNEKSSSRSLSPSRKEGDESEDGDLIEQKDGPGSLAEPARRRLSVLQSPPTEQTTTKGPEEDNDEVRGTVRQLTMDDLSRAVPSVTAKPATGPPRLSYRMLIEGDTGERRTLPKHTVMISGLPVPPGEKQHNFENKFESRRGSISSSVGLAAIGIGYCCRKGLKPESPNQDDFTILVTEDVSLFGVFDGHGPFGHLVSGFVQKNLPELVFDSENFVGHPQLSLSNAFAKVQEMLLKDSDQHRIDASLSGTTATVVVHKVDEKKLYVAHVGDSRCVQGKKLSTGQFHAVELTTDHKPNSETELKRITAAGGQVKRLEGDVPFRVFLKGRVYPGLAMSRALGDSVGAEAGVISHPDTSVFDVDPTEEDGNFLLICSDGVWEFIDSAEAVQIVSGFPLDKVQEAAESLAREAWNRWICEEGDVVDDITVEIVHLNAYWKRLRAGVTTGPEKTK